MTTHLSPRDWEALSAYLDGQLAPNERARLEKRLQGSHDLRTALEELRRTRAVLRSQPRLRAPRSFALTPEMVGRSTARPRLAGSLFPTFRLASALAGVLFVVVLLADLLGAGPAAAPPFQVSSQPQVEQEEAASIRMRDTSTREVEAPAGVEAPAAEALPAEAGAGETEAPAAELYALIDPTEMARMTAEAPGSAPGGEATEAAQSQADEVEAALPSPSATPAIPIPTEIDPQTQKLEAPSPQSAQAEAAESQAFDQAAPVPPPAGFWTPLRLAEAALAIFALGTGLAALLMRRSGAR